MKRNASLLAIVLAFAAAALAQHGAAENGYYPLGYAGDTWSGVVTSANERTGEITLTYTKGSKSQIFVGVPEKDYLVHEHTGMTRPLRMSDIPIGRTIKVWYIPHTIKVDGKKVSVNTIIQIDIAANAKTGRVNFMGFPGMILPYLGLGILANGGRK